MEVISYGKNVIVKQRAKGVLVFGANAEIEGRVEGDVATVGGSVVQRKSAFIGGDVFIIGGRYMPESLEPLRVEGKETVMYAGYEEELRELTQNPASLLSPTFSLTFIAQRLLSVLFWFVVSIGFAAIAPGAVGRAVAKLRLSSMKIVGIGILIFVLTTIAMIASVSILPDVISAVVGIMVSTIFLLAYVFGRVAAHVAVGKILQRWFFGDRRQPEAIAILAGVVFWTAVLSVPFVWTLALVGLFSVGIGLVVTARTPSNRLTV